MANKLEKILISGLLAGSLTACSGGSGSSSEEPEPTPEPTLSQSEVVDYISSRLHEDSVDTDSEFETLPDLESCKVSGRFDINTNTGSYNTGICFSNDIDSGYDFPKASNGNKLDIFSSLPEEPTQEELTEYVNSIRDNASSGIPPIFGTIPTDDMPRYGVDEVFDGNFEFRSPFSLTAGYHSVTTSSGDYVTSGGISVSNGLGNFSVDLNNFAYPDTLYDISVNLENNDLETSLILNRIKTCPSDKPNPTDDRTSCENVPDDDDNGDGFPGSGN